LLKRKFDSCCCIVDKTNHSHCSISSSVNVQETVEKVMTRNPFAVSPDISVLEALETMHSERFLTLPVCEEDGTVVGLVDVMDVIYGCGGADGWRSIFSSAIESMDDGTNSVGHGSTAKASVTSALRKSTRTKAPSVTPYVTDLPGNIPLVLEFKDDDHVSFTGSTIGEDRVAFKSSLLTSPEDVSMGTSVAGAAYKIGCPNGSTHRIRCEPKVEDLFDAITEKIRIPRSRLRVEYEDDEGDVVVITTDDDVLEAWNHARKAGKQVAKLSVVERGQSFDQNPAVFVGAGVTALALLGVLTFTLMRQSK
jgi:PB1 domain/CBS domain